MKSQFRAKRKVSGKIYVNFRKKKQAQLGGDSALTHIGNRRLRNKRVRGGNSKKSLLSGDFVLVSNGGKVEKMKILAVESNPANIHYTRRNIMTKGAIVKTEKGSVKITSRPGQGGLIQGVFVK